MLLLRTSIFGHHTGKSHNQRLAATDAVRVRTTGEFRVDGLSVQYHQRIANPGAAILIRCLEVEVWSKERLKQRLPQPVQQETREILITAIGQKFVGTADVGTILRSRPGG